MRSIQSVPVHTVVYQNGSVASPWHLSNRPTFITPKFIKGFRAGQAVTPAAPQPLISINGQMCPSDFFGGIFQLNQSGPTPINLGFGWGMVGGAIAAGALGYFFGRG